MTERSTQLIPFIRTNNLRYEIKTSHLKADDSQESFDDMFKCSTLHQNFLFFVISCV